MTTVRASLVTVPNHQEATIGKVGEAGRILPGKLFVSPA